MKRLEQLIDMARNLSGNTRYDDDSGVPQKVFVQYFNNAQDSLIKEVVNLKTKFLLKTSDVIPIVSGQETYSYPYDLYMQHIDTIQWTDKTFGSYYQTLYKNYTKEKVTNTIGFPFGYIMQNDGYHLNPPMTNGFLYLTYIKSLPKLQKKGGAITAVSLAGQTLSGLTISTSGTYDSVEINDDFYLCVVDKHGIQKARNIEYTSQAAGVFTLPSQALGTGQTIAVGDFIVVGKNSTNLPEWPDVCESYLVKHAVYDAKYSDSSSWSTEAKDDMRAFFQTLSGSFATLSDDVTDIAMTNTDFIGF